MKEIWKEVNSFEGYYWVSNLGRIKNRHNRILVPEIRNNYYSVDLCKNGKRKKYRIHRLVAEAFLPNPDSLPQVNHKDANKLNNTVSNLEWCSNTYNSQYPKDLSVYCFDLDETFKSATDASAITKISRTSIVKACNDQLKTAGGKWWCYAKDKTEKFPHRV